MIGHEVFVTGFLATASLMRYVTLRRKGVGESRNGKNIRDFNPFDAAYVAQIFEQLESKIESHILEKSIPAQTVFDVDDRIKEGNVNIQMMSLEKALKLYLDIKNQHADYIQQFYFAVAGILNQNCQCLTGISDDEELPF